jgi:hypothetical protein
VAGVLVLAHHCELRDLFAEAGQRQVRSRGRKAQQEIVSQLEAEIFKLETHASELTAELENPVTCEKPGRAAGANWRRWINGRSARKIQNTLAPV